MKNATLEAFIKTIKKTHSSQIIISDHEAMRVYETDSFAAYRQLPGLVVCPENLEQVRSVIKLALQFSIPVVTRGAGTGLSGGALPLSNGVLLNLAKLKGEMAIDVENCLVEVQCGMRNLAISEAVAHLGLFYAPDPSSQIACTIGGNVAENSGGVHCLKYGLTVHNITAIHVLTPHGDDLLVGGKTLDSPGYDLLALMTGSEGLLGVITSVTAKLIPKPACTEVLLAYFDEIVKAGESVAAIIASGIIPAGLEMMDNMSIRAVEDFIHAGYPIDAAAILLCELDGDYLDVEEQVRLIQQVLKVHGALSVRVAQDDLEKKNFWAGRKASFPAVGRLSPDYYCMDGTIPRKHLATVLNSISELSKVYQLSVANVFHAGDGNLHPLIMYDANDPESFTKAERFGEDILSLCLEVGGTITGEHGVGIEKLNSMCHQFTTAELNCFHAIKKAFDPQEILNPGKAIPTLQRCAEFGAMHVNKGTPNFPELERF